ncbi:glycosyltransferase family 4 protein [Nocardioides campestrisoli]|uniref:glycosyltransferase family 4 protein n=1 Tax=Nocardioides campestrisoli TaxID=2736757 RepID=UPI0015E68545|nr:glycosyltransferase family 4 protein [Nocardioides campestrisoli]
MTGSAPRRVVLVTHDASRTGAPMVALLVARCLVADGDRVRVVSRRRGPLLADFEAVAPTRLELLLGVRRRLWLVRSLRLVAWLVDVAAATATLARHRPDLVYLNTTASAIYLHPARWLRIPALLHVHESDANTDLFLDQARVMDLSAVRLVACSVSVQHDLMARTGRGDHEVLLLPSVPDGDRVRALSSGRPGTTADMEVPDATSGRAAGPVVGATGSVGLRKGTDLWLEVAATLHAAEETRSTRFVWVGELGDPDLAVPRSGVAFTGPRSNPYPEMARFDVATLPSRDDPFPLVVLESMLLGKPVVAFDVGSVREQVGDGGIVVPAGDVPAFAAAVRRLVLDADLREDLGATARARAEQHFSAASFAGRLRSVLDHAAGSSAQAPTTAARQARYR